MKIITSTALLSLVLGILFLNTAGAQPLTVTTIAGHFRGSGYLNGVGTNTLFNFDNPALNGMVADQAGNFYVVNNNAIRKIGPDLTVTTFAGSPVQSGYWDDTGTNALFDNPSGIAVDTNGNLYVADTGNDVVREISSTGVVTTLAGDGNYGHVDTDTGTPEFENPIGIAVDLSGNVFVTDANWLREISASGKVSTLAGNVYGYAGFADGNGTNAEFNNPYGLAVDAVDTIYVAEYRVIRKASTNGDVTTWVGNRANFTDTDGILTNAGFDGIFYLAADHAGGLYVADFNAGTIRYVSSAGVVTTVAGLANQSEFPGNGHHNDGVGTNAWFDGPMAITVDPWGSVYITDASDYTVLKGEPPSLSPIGSFSESPGVTPVRSNNPWQFTAYFTNIVSDLKLRVQSTTTTNNEASWTDLPGNPYMTDVGGNWTLNITDVPTGTQYFRVIAAAPGYFNSASAAAGPEYVMDGIAPFGLFKWETSYPNQSGSVWVFNITEPSVIPGLNLRVQSSEDGNTWNDLPGGQMTAFGSTWALDTTNVPTGDVMFQVVASALNYVDRISASLGPFTITPPLPPVMESSSTSGTYSLDSIMGPDPQEIFFNAVQAAVVKFGCTDTVQYNSAVNLAGQQYAAAVLQIEASQNVPILAANMGQNSTLILKGAITGDVSLITQDGGGLITQDGGSLTYDAGTENLITQDGGGLITQDGGGLITQDGGGLITQDGGGLITQDGGGLITQDGGSLNGQVSSGESSAGSKSKKNGPVQPFDQTQPTFIGQMTINGNYSQFSGTTLMIGIAGTNTLSGGAQQFDQLVVSGQANLIGGTIAFELFDPNDRADRTNVFQPPVGTTFDVVVASNIVVDAVHIRGPVWGNGLFFSGSVVTRDDGLQAVRLVATPIPPQLFLMNANTGSALRLVYGTNYTGYTVQSCTSLSLSNWTTFSTGTNVVILSPTNSSQFFRLSNP